MRVVIHQNKHGQWWVACCNFPHKSPFTFDYWQIASSREDAISFLNDFPGDVWKQLPQISDEFDRQAIVEIIVEFENMGATVDETVAYLKATAYVNENLIEDEAIATMKRIRKQVERRTGDAR